MTDVLLVPWRANAALIAKQALTVHSISGGRFKLGVAIGAWRDDYEVSGVPIKGQAKRFEEMLATIKSVWAGEVEGFGGRMGPPAPRDLRVRRASCPSTSAVPITRTTYAGSYRMSRQDVLVTADWAEKNLGTDGIVFVEVDEDTTAYDGGHIPGAVKINWTNELQDPVRRDIVDKEQFEKLLSTKGIANDDLVVLYGGNNNWFAAYAYWEFKLYGHGSVKLLDGGRKKWELDARELSTEQVTRPATSYTAKEPNLDIRAFRDEVVKAIGTRSLVDVRSPDEYAGRLLAPAHLPQEQAQRGGHIPTAINVPWSKAANDDGTFKSDEELKELYSEAGLSWDNDIIAYCRIGERSAHTWFVLHQILEQKNVKNYDGSWTEYGSLVGVPVAVGDEPGNL